MFNQEHELDLKTTLKSVQERCTMQKVIQLNKIFKEALKFFVVMPDAVKQNGID